MTRDPIRRRFGKGAARLRIGLPESAERLSALARTPIRLERRLTIVPFATAALIAWLLATSPLLSPSLAPPAPDEIQVALDAWPAPRAVAPPPEALAEAPRELPRKAPSERASDSLAARGRPGPSMAHPADSAVPEQTRTPFDPAQLATRAPNFSKAEILASADRAVTAATARAESRFASQATSSAMPAGLASASHAPAAAALAVGVAESTAASAPSSHRPGADRVAPSASASNDLVAATQGGDRGRRAYLTALERDAAASNGASASGDPLARRPEVSAARPSESLFAATSSGTGPSNGTALDGWQEVPLDELPDCTPAGRQDLLKKRILLAAPFQRECSHPSGSYRFVETRTLGAFLMWSRPNPGQRAGQPRDRDACDVLERALACLGDRSSQESSSR